MNKKYVLFILLGLIYRGYSQDTFSIVAVDTNTREVGGAGASCINNSSIINDLHPNRGAIHTQAYYYAPNQTNAKTKMNQGLSPQKLIDWLVTYDVNVYFGNTLTDYRYRQYGIADFDSSGNPRTAAYSGVKTDSFSNHITGRNYSIQGNILIGQKVLDSMEARFLRAQGTLADKLMAGLQGANMPGADTRCLSLNISSKSSFLKVAKPTDSPTSPYINLVVASVPSGKEPIDSLQTLYDNWKISTSVAENKMNAKVAVSLFLTESNYISIFNIAGICVYSKTLNNGDKLEIPTGIFKPGIYILRMKNYKNIFSHSKIVVY